MTSGGRAGAGGTMKKQTGSSYTIGGVDKEEILSKLEAYNSHYSGKNGQLDWVEVNGGLVITGLLRLHWKVKKQIQFKAKDDVPISENVGRAFRKSYMMAIDNGFGSDPSKLFQLYDDPRKNPSHSTLPTALNGASPARTAAAGPSSPLTSAAARRERTASTDDDVIVLRKKTEVRRFHTVCYKGERNKRKRFSINGHFYDGETSSFTPAEGTVTTVRVNSLNSTTEVIQALLDKFKVENNADEFCLMEAKRNGEMIKLMKSDYPLLERLLLGPEEDEAKIYIMDSDTVAGMSQDVDQYVSLPEAVLRGFLGRLTQEEAEAMEEIRAKFGRWRDKLELRLRELTNEDLQQSES